MKTLFKYSVLLVIVYLAAWTVSYVTMFDGRDFSHFFEYLTLAWTFRGGEIPTYLWWFSVLGFFPLAGFAVFFLKKYDRHRHPAV